MKKFIIFFFFFIFFFFPSFAFASNFITDYNVTYTVRPDAITNVEFKVTLTNKTSQYYASSYNIKAGFKKIENLKASDQSGLIVSTVTEEGDEKNVGVTFNDKVVGINNKLIFILSFDTPDIVDRFGKIWEINIPGLARQDYESFNASVIVPSFLGNPTFVKPQINGLTGNNLVFNKEQLGRGGIAIAFGTEQIYKFSLKYHLSNPNLFPIKTEIALPPRTNYQEIEIKDINPKPLNVVEDKDGNWLAQYSLLPSTKKDITVTGQAKLSLFPQKETLAKESAAYYLRERPYWQVSSEKIKKLAQELQTPFAIYEYVVKNLKYDFSRVTEGKGRVGALGVLANPTSAVCMEFTDLFIALARAAGIPAREVDGFAYTQSKERPLSLYKDILHAWPEYYDFEKETWIMVDPTWGNTTRGIDYFSVLDFDHFAFVIKGQNSNYPVPAGGYKLSDGGDSKDVFVAFADSFEEKTPMLSVQDDFSKKYPSGVPILGKIIIGNVGESLVGVSDLVVYANILKPSYQKIGVSKIPPFGFLTVPVSFSKTPILTNIRDTIKIAIGGKTISFDIDVYPFFFNKYTLIGGIIFVILTIYLSIAAARAGHLPFFRQKR